jgi:microcystin-dependent protein
MPAKAAGAAPGIHGFLSAAAHGNIPNSYPKRDAKMKHLALGIALLLATTSAASAQALYLGEIYTFAFNYCPYGTLPTNGALLQISSNSVLFNLLGTNYGGDGKTTFALPNITPPAANFRFPTTSPRHGLIDCIATAGIYPSQN